MTDTELFNMDTEKRVNELNNRLLVQAQEMGKAKIKANIEKLESKLKTKISLRVLQSTQEKLYYQKELLSLLK